MDNEISLYDLEQAAVLLLAENGVVYSNQAGGTACMQPKERGTLIPISNDPPLDNFYKGAPPFKLTGACQDLVGLDSGAAEALDKILSEAIEHKIQVDRSRLQESMEAWVYVLFNGQKGLLTWPNSD